MYFSSVKKRVLGTNTTAQLFFRKYNIPLYKWRKICVNNLVPWLFLTWHKMWNKTKISKNLCCYWNLNFKLHLTENWTLKKTTDITLRVGNIYEGIILLLFSSYFEVNIYVLVQLKISPAASLSDLKNAFHTTLTLDWSALIVAEILFFALIFFHSRWNISYVVSRFWKIYAI